jgi:mRNA-degrading endonuclease RelE of RelBE toxin-antitoxin system
MYSIIHVEMRYISPFLVLVPGALVTSLRTENPESKRIAQSSFVLTATILILIVFSAWGQSARSLYSVPGKPSFEKSYLQMATLNQQLRDYGVASGSHLAVVGLPPIYWARIGGYRIIGEIPDVDEFLAVGIESRSKVVENLKRVGMRAIIARDKRFSELASEGWKPLIGVDDFYVLLL